MTAAPFRMPYEGTHVPHAVLEVNQRCNVSCVACYKDRSTYTKPFELIERELDLAARARSLSVVSLAGGEPTLHPRLGDVIELVARRGIGVQLLSNGLGTTEERWRELRARGLQRVYLHVDSLQRRTDAPRGATRESDLDALREELAERVVGAGLRCALSATIYRTRNLAQLPGLVRFVLASRRFDRLLVTCCTDFAALGARLHQLGRTGAKSLLDAGLAPEVVSNDEVATLLARELSFHPYAFVASSHRPDERRWLYYYAFARHEPDGRTSHLALGSAFGRIARLGMAASRLVKGRYPFEMTLGRSQARALCLAYAAATADSTEIARVLRFLRPLADPRVDLQQKSFVFQQGPNLTPGGAIETCRACPDATVRNGRLVPVCLADVLEPAADDVPRSASARSSPLALIPDPG